MQQKHFQEASLQQYNPISEQKKQINKQPNITPEETRERRTTKKIKCQWKERNHKDWSSNK